MYRALQATPAEVVPLGAPYRVTTWSRATRRLRDACGVPRAVDDRFRSRGAEFCQVVTKQLAHQRCDVLVAPVASHEIEWLKPELPVIYASDVTYRVYAPMYGVAPTEADDRIEQHAIDRAAAIAYSSEWAADSARKDYGARPDKVFVVPFGANLPDVPDPALAEQRVLTKPLRLLFLGKEWERKGGPLVLQTVTELRRRGVETHLVIAGCTPPNVASGDGVEVIPYLDKTFAADRQRMHELWRDSHLFFMPTRAEAFGMVFCEAAAYGLPAVTTAVGGVPSAVAAGESGLVLPLAATATDYAEAICQLLSRPDEYSAIARGARRRFEQVLNWSAWGERVYDIALQVAERRVAERTVQAEALAHVGQ
jgi:glycosyltransferase involved in cell wall biosynthesis